MIRRIAKRIIPEKGLDSVLRLRRKLTRSLSKAIIPIAASTRLTSRVYYTLFSSAFAREQQAILYGRMKYEEDRNRQNPEEGMALLRRNTHRLEKGLLMRPRRPVFAVGYIEETVDIYVRRLRAIISTENNESSKLKTKDIELNDLEEMRWANDVLYAYFDVADASHPTLARAHKAFKKTESFQNDYPFSLTPSAERGQNGKRVPYARSTTKSPVSYEALKQLAYRRRSVRWFADTSVPRSHLDKAIEIGAQAPSACNRQPFEFRVYDDPKLVKKIASLPGGTTGYAENIPVIVVLLGRLRAYFSERDRHLIYIDGSLAAMNFMMALETFGLGSCAINWPDVEKREREIDRVLNLEPDERPIMMIGVGYPAREGLVAYSQKKNLSRIRAYNKI